MADFQVKSAIFNALGRSPPPLQAHSQRPFDVGMAEFISNSAISLPIRASAVLAAAPNSGPGRPKMADFTLKSAILRQVDRGGLVA